MQGSAPAEYELAMLYQQGESELGLNLEKAFMLYKRAAEKGHILATCRVAEGYEQGLGIEKNLNKFHKWHAGQ